jgi:hypothetical protein
MSERFNLGSYKAKQAINQHLSVLPCGKATNIHYKGIALHCKVWCLETQYLKKC